MPGYCHEIELSMEPDTTEEPVVMLLEMELDCTQFGEAPSGMSGPPEFYDPGCGPEFNLDEVRISLGKDSKDKPIGDIVLKPAQFDAMFGKELSDKLFEEACDAASETGEFG